MTTKKTAAMEALALARSLRNYAGGDEDIETVVLRLVWLAEGLYPQVRDHPAYGPLVLYEGESRQVKLRRMIEHPATPATEREAAVRALARLEGNPDSPQPG